MPGIVEQEVFALQARYNTEANRRLYAACGTLDDAKRKKLKGASFGSIHGILNHVLKGDRIWLARFEGHVVPSTGLSDELYADFSELREARAAEDARTEQFMATSLSEDLLGASITYVNNQGKTYRDPVPMLLTHFFNHQTHHRGQVHTLLRESGVPSLNLDLHRIANP